MTRIYKIILIVAALTFIVVSQGCKDDDLVEQDSKLTLTVNPQLYGNLIEFDSAKYQNELNEKFEVSTLKYFLSSIYLHNQDGDSVLLKDVQYFDGRDLDGHRFEVNLKNGKYTMMTVYFGIPASENITNRFNNPPESQMVWPVAMGGGYHYMKFEGKFLDTNQLTKNFQLHTGPTMGNDFSVRYEFPLNLDVDHDSNIELLVHLDRWLNSPNVLSFEVLSMIMGNMEMQMKLKANGTNVIELGLIE